MLILWMGTLYIRPPRASSKCIGLTFSANYLSKNVEDACFFRYNRQKIGEVLSIDIFETE
jgi:hypothetical protein